MDIKQSELREAVMVLLNNSNFEGCKKVGKALQEILDDIEKDVARMDNDADLIDRNHFFGSVLWLEEDIINKLYDEGYKDTDDAVYQIARDSRKPLQDRSIDMGWAVIENSIRDLEKHGKLEKK
jgi:hypothetical protein